MIKSLFKNTTFLYSFLYFYLFIFFFKLSASLHYTMLSPLGEKFFPIWLVGIIVGGVTFIQLLLDIPAGRMLDKYGYKKMLIVSNLFFIIAILVLLFGINQYTYLLTALMSILGWVFFAPGVSAYLLSQAPESEGGRVMSYRDIFGSAAVVIGSGGLFYVLSENNFILTALLFIPFVISLVFILLAPNEKRDSDINNIEMETKHFYIRRNIFKNIFKTMKKLNPASTMLLLTGLGSSIFYSIVWFVIPYW